MGALRRAASAVALGVLLSGCPAPNERPPICSAKPCVPVPHCPPCPGDPPLGTLAPVLVRPAPTPTAPTVLLGDL